MVASGNGSSYRVPWSRAGTRHGTPGLTLTERGSSRLRTRTFADPGRARTAGASTRATQDGHAGRRALAAPAPGSGAPGGGVDAQPGRGPGPDHGGLVRS